jgi:GTP-binding protein LepA
VASSRAASIFDTEISPEHIRNFSIIAHINHGKSTLADCMLEQSGNITQEEKVAAPQLLDSLRVERERGITVKATTASIMYRHPSGTMYLLNLIDTPGHVDFSYAVTQSLQACEGALLLVDSSQGVQAQTLANFLLAKKSGLDIITVLTKTDLPYSNKEEIIQDLNDSFGISPSSILTCSAKSGLGVANLFPAIVDRIRAPSGLASGPLRAIITQTWYDQFHGVICLVKVIDGELRRGDRIVMYHGGNVYDVADVGFVTPGRTPRDSLSCGQVGYIICGIRAPGEVQLGDTFFQINNNKELKKNQFPALIAAQKPKIQPWPGFEKIKSMVYAGIFPSSSGDFDELSKALKKLVLTDPSVSCEPESSIALGAGFRCGFLGTLHMEVFTQRLDQDFETPVVITSPTTPCTAKMKDGVIVNISGPNDFPDVTRVQSFYEPWVNATIITPELYMGDIMSMCEEYRGELAPEGIDFMGQRQVRLRYMFPLSEIVSKFYDKLKTLSSGYASFDYDPAGDRPTKLTCLTVLLNEEKCDALSLIVPAIKSQSKANEIASKLGKTIARQMCLIHVQVCDSGKVLASEKIKPYRKDVLTKGGKTVGGGDVTRKKKLLEKQKEGKKRMKMVGNVELEESVFLAMAKD